MASTNFMLVPNTKLSLILTLLLAILLCSESRPDHGLLQVTNMTLYVHDYFSGANATSIAISTASDERWIVNNFGTMYCTDSPVTEAIEADSDYVGRAQGTFVSSAMDGSTSQVVMSLVFDAEQYRGSTLQIQGAGAQTQRVKEVSVVSGTGDFRYARGFATFEIVYYERAANYSVAEWIITVEHY